MTRGLVQWMVFVDLTTRDVVAIITLAARNHSSGLGPPRGPTSLCIRCRGVLAIFNPARPATAGASRLRAAPRRAATHRPTDANLSRVTHPTHATHALNPSDYIVDVACFF